VCFGVGTPCKNHAGPQWVYIFFVLGPMPFEPNPGGKEEIKRTERTRSTTHQIKPTTKTTPPTTVSEKKKQLPTPPTVACSTYHVVHQDQHVLRIGHVLNGPLFVFRHFMGVCRVPHQQHHVRLPQTSAGPSRGSIVAFIHHQPMLSTSRRSKKKKQEEEARRRSKKKKQEEEARRRSNNTKGLKESQ
jgi:hypothetical protein